MINECYRKRLELRRRAIARKRWEDIKFLLRLIVGTVAVGWLLILMGGGFL